MTDNATIYEITAQAGAGSGTATARSKASQITFDAGPLPNPDLPGPADLLATAFGACVLKNVSRFSEILRFRYDDATIRVIAVREEGSPPRIARIHYSLNITTDEPDRRVDLLHRNIQKYGTIYNTLAASTEVSGEITATTSTAVAVRV